MSYQINLGQWKSVFVVPSSVVDQHIKIASESQLKVLLYLLRHAEDKVDEDNLSQALRLSKDEIANAVNFWIERELLMIHEDTLIPAKSADQPTPGVLCNTPVEQPKKPHTTISRARRPDSAFVAKLLKEDPYLAGILEEAQTVLKKPLSPGDTATLVMLYDTFGLPCEVIALLLNYLAENGNANMRAVERTGIRWADNGIKTVEDAEAEIERMTSSKIAWGRVSSLLGIRNVGNPTKSQLEHADRWLNTWRFCDEMITEAYERCVNTKGEYNIRYINAILQKWNEKDIRSLDQLKEEEENDARKKSRAKKGRSNPKGSVFSVENASFDVSKYENNSLFDD